MRRKHYAGMGKLAMEKNDPFVEEYLKRAEQAARESKGSVPPELKDAKGGKESKDTNKNKDSTKDPKASSKRE